MRGLRPSFESPIAPNYDARMEDSSRMDLLLRTRYVDGSGSGRKKRELEFSEGSGNGNRSTQTTTGVKPSSSTLSSKSNKKS
jgi:hypothetical protein